MLMWFLSSNYYFAQVLWVSSTIKSKIFRRDIVPQVVLQWMGRELKRRTYPLKITNRLDLLCEVIGQRILNRLSKLCENFLLSGRKHGWLRDSTKVIVCTKWLNLLSVWREEMKHHTFICEYVNDIEYFSEKKLRKMVSVCAGIILYF